MDRFPQALADFLVDNDQHWKALLFEEAAAAHMGVAELLMHMCRQAFPDHVRLMELVVTVQADGHQGEWRPYRSSLLQVGNVFVSMGGIVDMPALNEKITLSTRKLLVDRERASATIHITMEPKGLPDTPPSDLAPRAWALFSNHRPRMLSAIDAQALDAGTPPAPSHGSSPRL